MIVYYITKQFAIQYPFLVAISNSFHNGSLIIA
jgi:hypothetical protein